MASRRSCERMVHFLDGEVQEHRNFCHDCAHNLFLFFFPFLSRPRFVMYVCVI